LTNAFLFSTFYFLLSTLYFLLSNSFPLRSLRRCISRRAPQIESFFASRESSKHWGFACASLAPIHTDRGCRIRTISISSSEDPRNPCIHENERFLTILIIIPLLTIFPLFSGGGYVHVLFRDEHFAGMDCFRVVSIPGEVSR
jgi:hypothetical protein